MPEPRTCPQCGSPLPADAPDGMCPKCLLQMGFESCSGRAPDDSAHSPTVYQPGSLPPSIEDLAARFPQLELLERIGQGGMGVVYKARQKDLDRIVALKILRPEMESDPAFAGRFVREARALAKLSHPAIVTVHDFGRIDGFYYFIMEFIEGANLRELERSGKLQPRQALAIVPPICEALQYAHDQGVVHRDIKPENILIDTQGRVKIADFGLAKMVGAVPDATALTGAWQVMGTPHYMAPEQMKSSHSVDHRADIYSLGVVIYEMLTGELPVGRFPLPSRKVEIDVRLDEVVLKALEQEPAKRYQRAHELQTDVETIGTGAGARRAVSEVNSRIVDWTYVLSSPLGNPAVGEQPAPENRQKPLGLVSRQMRGLAITLLAPACLLIGLWSLFLAALTFALPIGAEDELDVLMRERPGLRTWHTVHQTAESWLEFPLAYALLAAGVGLLLRRPWGRWLASVWAVVNLILGLALLPLMFAGIALMFLQSPILAPEGEMEPSVLLAAFLGTLVVVTLDIVFPIIVLLVLSRPWVKEAFVRRGIAGLGEFLLVSGNVPARTQWSGF